MTPLYVYALVEQPMARLTVGGRALESIPVDRLFAVVERLGAAPPLTEESLKTQHAVVCALAGRVDAILPARFGAFIDDTQLEMLVRARSQALQEALGLVRGREQMTVRILGPRLETPEPLSAPMSGREYLSRRARPASEHDAAHRIREAVRELVAGERLDLEGRMHLAIHHLVSRGTAAQYRSAAGRATARLPSAITVRLSGPWPPFAFAPSLST